MCQYLRKMIALNLALRYIINKIFFIKQVIKEKQKIYIENKNGYKNSNDQTFQKNPRKKAFLDYILELTENDQNFKFEDIEEEVNTLMIAV